MYRLTLCWLIFGFCTLALEGLPTAAAATNATAAGATENVATATPSHILELQDGIFKGLQKVPEFQMLAQKAQELDVKAVYLFGGAAAALAHYVHRDLVHQHMQQLAPMGLSHQASQEQSAPTFDAALPNTPPFDVSSQSPPLFDETEFNYTLWSMLFYNQDIDIVVDTKDVQKIQHLDTAITAVATSNFKWDFWSLHTAYNNRPALLTSQDFAHQHTDSHSTILMPIYLSGHQTAPSLAVKPPLPKNIRTTTQSQPPLKKASRTSTQSQPPQQQPQIYDLRSKLLNESPFDMTTAASSHATQFLTDVLEKKLSCYYSAKHHQSPRYKKGDNPEIFFAVRTLTKAFQYGLDIPDDCMNRIQKIFKNFKADRDLKTDYSQYWIEKNAKKLYTQSIDLERSQRVLQQLGALEILKNIKGNTTEVNSMAWWLNRQPLLSRPIEQPTALPEALTIPLPRPGTSSRGMSPIDAAANKSAALDNTTAAQLGLRYVVHSTKTIEAYESIISSRDRRPNAFITLYERDAGDMLYDRGGGFYTSVVDNTNTSCTNGYGPFGICFQVHPQARQGVDFFIHYIGSDNPLEGSIIFTNKLALKIINSSVSQVTSRFQNWLAQGDNWIDKLQHLSQKERKLLTFILVRHPKQQDELISMMLKHSKQLGSKEYVKFWLESLLLLPSSYIALNYKKFLPPVKSKAQEELPLFIPLFVKIIHRIDDSQYKDQKQKFINTLLNFSKSLHIEDYIELWRRMLMGSQAGSALPIELSYISLNRQKFLPRDYESIIEHMPIKKAQQQKTKLAPDIAKKKVDAALLILGLERVFMGVHRSDDKYLKSHWHRFLKKILIKAKGLRLHKLSDVQLEPAFETVLTRVSFEAVEGFEESLYTLDQSFMRAKKIENRLADYIKQKAQPVSLPNDLALLFEDVVINNIDYFVKNNNILILKYLTAYILSHPASLPLHKQLAVLNKIIEHEFNLNINDLVPSYNVTSNLINNQLNKNIASKSVYYRVDAPILIADASIETRAFSRVFHLLWARPVMAVRGSSALDVVSSLYNSPSSEVDKTWSRLKDSKRMFKTIHKATHHYDPWMIIILMRRHWAQQPWALNLIENMIDNAIKESQAIKKIGKPVVHNHMAVLNSLLAVFLHPVINKTVIPSSSYFAPIGSKQFVGKYDYEYLAAHRQIIRILEKSILHAIHMDKELDTLMNLHPMLQQHFANKYFSSQNIFSIEQLREQIQNHHQKDKPYQKHECTTLLTTQA